MFRHMWVVSMEFSRNGSEERTGKVGSFREKSKDVSNPYWSGFGDQHI